LTFGNATSPKSRHLIFVLPFCSALVAAGLLDLARRVPRGSVVVAAVALAALASAEVAWGWHKTPPLYAGEPGVRVQARETASAWLAQTSRPGDVLFGYDPPFLGAWARAGNRI